MPTELKEKVFGKIQVREVKPHDQDHRKFQKLRNKVYARPGWSALGADGNETDQYDQVSRYLVVDFEGQVIAGCRIVYADTPAQLPFASYCEDPVLLSRKQKCVELSRWCFSDEITKRRQLQAHYLLGRACEELIKSDGISDVFVDVCRVLHKRLTNFNWPMSCVGRSHKRGDGTEFYPVSLDLTTSEALVA